MYKAFLSYAQLKEYLAMLTQNGLVAHDVEGEKHGLQAMGLNSLKALGAERIAHSRFPEDGLTRHV